MLSTIPAHRRFLDALATHLLARYQADPLALGAVTILLPTRRAVRSLIEAFLRASEGEPLLLPRIAAVGDLDDDELVLAAPAELAVELDLPPAMPTLRRQLLLARLIRRWGAARDGGAILPGHALALAGELARLIDQATSEGLSFDRLDGLVPAELAVHWQVTLDFLAIIRDHWPKLLEAEGMIDAADRRNRLIAAQISLWHARPPADPVIAAGFSSAIPAIGDLLAAVLDLSDGTVLLPGLDLGADEVLWTAIQDDPAHPQYGIAQLLDRLGRSRDDVTVWPGSVAARHGRDLVVREIMRPAAVSDEWRRLESLPAAALDGLTRLDLADSHAEAETVALMLRAELERPGATAMLVTPDRQLARRVAVALRRWGIEIDDSAGIPLNRTPPGVFLRLIADAVAEELAPVPLLALLKHPLAACGLDPAELREAVRALELAALRGPRPGPGIAGLRAALDGKAALHELLDRLDAALGPFIAVIGSGGTTLAAALAAHLAAAEALAATHAETGPARLWAQQAGEVAAQFAAELMDAAGSFEPIRGEDYPVLFEALLAGPVVRPRWGRHPRLQILGVLEARLQSADLVVLGGLNEGTWPPAETHDPWMSRQMRRQFGLPPLEARIGQAAHDLALALEGPEIVLTRALRAEGAPTLPSRWLLRLDAVLRAVGLDTLPEGARRWHLFPAYQALLDAPGAVAPCLPPAPTPPVAARPRSLSVTEIEMWMRDPYAIYARHVLGLDALEPIDADPGLAERGVFIHQALDRFVRQWQGPYGDSARDALIAHGRDAFGAAMARPSVWAFWWPRFLRIADWFLGVEAARRPLLAASLTERRGRLTIAGPFGPFTLRAMADRIDRFAAGGLAIIDYKTGSVPTRRDIESGMAPQLPLEAVIAQAGGFADIDATAVLELGFWRLTGGDPAGEFSWLENPAPLAVAAEAGLVRLIAAFDDPDTAYRARPRPDWQPRYSDYGHLARILEWGSETAE